MPSLSIHLFGSFDVDRDGQLVDMLRLGKAQALLAYLAVERQHAQRRELLATLLWPEAAEAEGRTNLRQLLHRLRLAIGDLDEARPLLLLSPQYVQLSHGQAVLVDVNAFASLLNVCRLHRHLSLAACDDCLDKMRTAVALYRGEFLADWRLPDSALYQDWVLLKQAELHNMAVTALSFLAHWHAQSGDYENADAYIQQQLRLEPWSEDAHRQRMSILTASGQRTAALKQFTHCRQVLAAELGVEPSWETKHLCEQIEQDLLCRPASGEAPAQQAFADLYSAAANAIVQARHLLAAEYIEQLMSLAQRCQAVDMIWLAKGLAGINESLHGDLHQARLHLEQVAAPGAGERSRRLRPVTGMDFYAACLTCLSWASHILGNFQQANEYAGQAVSQAEDHAPSKALLQLSAYIARYCLNTGPAIVHAAVPAEQVVSNADAAIAPTWYDLLNVSGSAGGGYASSIDPNPTSCPVAEEQSLAHILHALTRAELCARNDDVQARLVSISQTLAWIETTGTSVFAAELHRLRGQALLCLAAQQPQVSELRLSLEREAEISLCVAIDLAHTQQLPLWELRATTTLCRYYQEVGRRGALSLLAAICARFPEYSLSSDVAEAQHLLCSLRVA
jgi:DNA-binding SARP family transcriptional activator